MKEVAKLQIKDRTELFQATSISMGMQPNVIEKDFWVCFMLDHLFHDCRYKYPDIFSQKDTTVLTIDVERTFWEKLTILHKIANFPDGKPLPARYARHLYDVYNMGNSWVKERAFKRKELLEKDVAFKQKFYYAKGAHYETATLE